MNKYVAKNANKEGYVNYTNEEHEVFYTLYKKQSALLHNRACDEFISGIDFLGIGGGEIPQIPNINQLIGSCSEWMMEPVSGAISYDLFFKMLSKKKFPAATFIRGNKEINFTKEPDIFHEIFGHAPLLLNEGYADFSYKIGCLGESSSTEYKKYLFRLYWFTIETGLVRVHNSYKSYGGATLSSANEIVHSIESEAPLRIDFSLSNIFRMPYKIDILPPVYFIVQSLDLLYSLSNNQILDSIEEAIKLGMYKPLYPVESNEKRAYCSAT